MTIQQQFIHYNNHHLIQQDATPHQTFLEISQSAIDHNIAFYKNQIGNHNKLAVVIKGNGYGHGLEVMAQICEKNADVNCLCVANLSEAVRLRANNIQKTILVLGYADINFEYAVNKSISFMIDNLEYAQKLNAIGKKYSYQFTVHVKIDTGLSRLGITPHEATIFVQQLQKLNYLLIEGIFSHFIASNSNPVITNKQFNLFQQTIKKCSFLTNPYIHMSNTHSTVTLTYPSLFNFFRVGLGIYGFDNTHAPLQPALTWKTHVASIKTVAAHSYVSYACTYKTTRTTRIALLPIGYADGYQLRFSNTTSVLINNAIAPVIGRVGMNMTMIDVTDCTANNNDEVTLIGTTPPIRATDISQAGNIFNVREFLTGIHPNIPRIITQ